jgi:hypothetical protein
MIGSRGIAMKTARSIVTMVTLAAVFLGLVGCASQKEPAEQALASIEKTLETSGAQLQKYLPERYEEISGKVTALRESLAVEDYGAVVSGAPAIAGELRRAVADSAIRRAQTRVEMEAEWAELVKTMPVMIESVDKGIAAQAGRPPKGMDREAYKALVATYDAARASWGKISESIDSANFETTVTAAREAKTAITGVMDSLGIKAS